MKGFNVIFPAFPAFLLSALLSVTALAQGGNWTQLTAFLNNQYPESYKVLSPVQHKYGTRLAFKVVGAKPRRGAELLVLKNQKGVPIYLQPQAAVIRVESVMDGQVLAQEMAQLGEPVDIGDPVVVPSSPVVYLYTNIKNKESFSPYTQLLQELLNKNFEVVELFEPRIKQHTDRYGILVRLEGGERHLALRVQSIYSGDTLYFKSISYTGSFLVQAPVGRQIVRYGAPPIASIKPQAPTTAAQAPMVAATPLQPSKPAKATFKQARITAEKEYYKLDKAFKRLVICELNGDETPEVVLLNDKGIAAYQLFSTGLQPLATLDFNDSHITALHLHAMDVTGDGRDELFVTLGREINVFEELDTELSSMVVMYKKGHLVPLAKGLPYYFRVTEDRSGQLVLLGQKKKGTELFAGNILKLTWNPTRNRFDFPQEYGPAHDIYSIYQFNLIPGDDKRVLILEPTNFLHVYYTPTETVDAVSDKNYGDFAEIPFKIRPAKEQYMGGFTKKSYDTVFAPRRFVLKTQYDDQMFLIHKERVRFSVTSELGTLMKSKQGEDRLVAVKWVNGQIQETWHTEGVAKDLIDFGFYSQPGDERLFALVRDSRGYAIEVMN